MAADHFFSSAPRKAASAFGVACSFATGSMLRSEKRETTVGSARAVWSAALSFATTGSGVPAGA